jgi:hypothetical protein
MISGDEPWPWEEIISLKKQEGFEDRRSIPETNLPFGLRLPGRRLFGIRKSNPGGKSSMCLGSWQKSTAPDTPEPFKLRNERPQIT